MEEIKPRQTSENFKIILKNLPQFGFSEIKKFLKKLELKPTKIKGNQNRGKYLMAYVCFENETERNLALKKLDGFTWKKKQISASIASAVQDPMERHRNNENKKPPQKLSPIEATAPLSNMPYDDQLKFKENEALQIFKKYGQQIQEINFNLQGIIKKQIDENNEFPCKWHGIKPSPNVDGYRNKSEFNIGRNSDGDKVVGCRTGSYINGSVEVCGIDDLPHIPNVMKTAAKTLEKFIRESLFDVFNPETNTGEFRQLTVRVSSATNELMLVIGLNLKKEDEKFDQIKNEILKYFTNDENEKIDHLSSMYLQSMCKNEKGNQHNLNQYVHIYGNNYITDVLCGYKFRISPSAFFQVNTNAAEVLYKSTIEMAAPTENTTVLDICCGTGTIGICFSKHCAEVLGVELNAEAIQDAEFNALENNVSNCQFFAGNCDDYIDDLIHKAKTDNIIAIVDPPRSGLHARSISALRKASGLKRFIYISCSPKDALRNWIDLGRNPSKTFKGDPFIPVAAFGVDMFPHARHMEIVILFERVSK